MRKNITALFALLITSTSVCAQQLDKATETWNESKTNQLENVRYNSNNPVSISYNTIKTYCVALVDYTSTTGKLHSVDQPAKQGDLGVYIGGLKNVGNFDLSGYIKYNNTSTTDSRWNSTIHLNPNNPFILADSVFSNQTIETFDMNAMASYRFNEQWTAGASIGYKSGRLSDQTDPRPETNYSDLPVKVGAEYALNNKWHIGAVAGIRLFREDISYTIINPLDAYQYFLLKGNGDFFRRSTSEVSGYQREYKGTDYTGGLQATWDINNQMVDHLEANFTSGDEIATDEGSMPFHGGDYKYSKIDLSNRLLIKKQGWLHNIVLAGSIDMGKGDWYDQKKMTDTDHGNRVYYAVLSKYQIHKNTNINAVVEYRLDKLYNTGKTNWYADAKVMMDNIDRTQTSGSSTKQKGMLLNFQLSAGKNFQIKKVELDASLRGGYAMPSSNTFQDGSSYQNMSIMKSYSLPAYQYQFAKRMNVGATIDAHLPLKQNMILGVIAKVDYQRCNGVANVISLSNYAIDYNSTNRTQANVGVYMKF